MVDPEGGPQAAELSVGAMGEVLLGGAQVGLGYHGLPTLTADRFVTRSGQRWYRTGDLGRLIPTSGELELHGRADDQVKVCDSTRQGLSRTLCHEHNTQTGLFRYCFTCNALDVLCG